MRRKEFVPRINGDRSNNSSIPSAVECDIGLRMTCLQQSHPPFCFRAATPSQKLFPSVAHTSQDYDDNPGTIPFAASKPDTQRASDLRGHDSWNTPLPCSHEYWN